MHTRFPAAEQAELAGTFQGYGAEADTATRMAAEWKRFWPQRPPPQALPSSCRNHRPRRPGGAESSAAGSASAHLPGRHLDVLRTVVSLAGAGLQPALPLLCGRSVVVTDGAVADGLQAAGAGWALLG